MRKFRLAEHPRRGLMMMMMMMVMMMMMMIVVVVVVVVMMMMMIMMMMMMTMLMVVGACAGLQPEPLQLPARRSAGQLREWLPCASLTLNAQVLYVAQSPLVCTLCRL
jgi:hypothetical protein